MYKKKAARAVDVVLVNGQGYITLSRPLPPTTMTPKVNVLLLREPTPSSDSDQDRYEAVFAATKYTPFLVPVLETVLTNITELASVTEQSDFDGVIMTSTRSCETWDKANGTEKDGTCRVH